MVSIDGVACETESSLLFQEETLDKLKALVSDFIRISHDWHRTNRLRKGYSGDESLENFS